MNYFPSDDHRYDEDEVEISDLSEEQDTSQQITSPTTKTMLVSLRNRLSGKQRRKRLLITTSIVVLAIIVFLSSMAPVRALVLAKLSPASSSMASSPVPVQPAPGASLIYLQVLPKWGHVLVDGHILSSVPEASVVTPGQTAPLELARGVHLIRWEAAPFKPLQCVLVVPLPSKASTCQVMKSRPNQFTNQAWLVGLPVSLADLPASERAALIQSTQALLATFQRTAMVQVGERYVVISPPSQQAIVQVAQQPLLATLSFQLQTTTQAAAICNGVSLSPQPFSCAIAGQDCRLFCTLFWPGATSGWDVTGIIRPEWSYQTLDGQLIAQHEPDTLMAYGQLQFITFHIEWHGHWRVTFHPTGASTFDDPICIATESDIFTNPALDQVGHTDLVWNFYASSTVPGGCLVTGTISVPAQISGGVPILEKHVYLLHRFGVLLAANSLAHQLWPQLPQASAQEQAMVSQIFEQKGR